MIRELIFRLSAWSVGIALGAGGATVAAGTPVGALLLMYFGGAAVTFAIVERPYVWTLRSRIKWFECERDYLLRRARINLDLADELLVLAESNRNVETAEITRLRRSFSECRTHVLASEERARRGEP